MLALTLRALLIKQKGLKAPIKLQFPILVVQNGSLEPLKDLVCCHMSEALLLFRYAIYVLYLSAKRYLYPSRMYVHT